MQNFDLVGTLYRAYGPCVNVCVPFGKNALEKSIDEMEFSIRATNCLKRAGYFTVGAVVDRIASGGLGQLRNLGRKTENEIKTKLLVYGFEQLNPKERLAFLKDVQRRN